MLVTRDEILEHAETDHRVLDAARVPRSSSAARRPGVLVPAAATGQSAHQSARATGPAAHPAGHHTPCAWCGLTDGARGGRWEIRGNAIVLLPH